MSNPAKAAGTRFERDLLEHLKSAGLRPRRLALAGAKDQGDIVFEQPGAHILIEAKAERRMNFAQYLRQLEREMEHYADANDLGHDLLEGIVVVKRPFTPIGKSYVVQTLDRYIQGWV